METKTKKPPTWTVGKLVYSAKEGIRPNYEYQRGNRTWKNWQKCLLIDSVLRGYQIPMVYLSKTKEGTGKYVRDVYHIIDGHQRRTALCNFCAEEKEEPLELSLFGPTEVTEHVDFPESLKKEECSWAGIRSVRDLSEEVRKNFLESEIPVEILEKDTDEVRDMFIRMQGGFSLNPQEIRDAMPGNFCKLVREIGGVPRQTQSGGHAFFKLAKTPRTDRGKIRTIVAQSLMLFLERNKTKAFRNTNSESLDRYYQEQVGLQFSDKTVKQFKGILDKLHKLLHDKHKNLSGTDIMHLILFTGEMQKRDISSQWERCLSEALRRFRADVAATQIAIKESKESSSRTLADVDSEILDYCKHSAKGSDRISGIRARHDIYVRRMLGLIGESADRGTRPSR